MSILFRRNFVRNPCGKQKLEHWSRPDGVTNHYYGCSIVVMLLKIHIVYYILRMCPKTVTVKRFFRLKIRQLDPSH